MQLTISRLEKTELANNSGMRYNDYGIAMLRQNNLEASRLAFENVTKLIPGICRWICKHGACFNQRRQV